MITDLEEMEKPKTLLPPADSDDNEEFEQFPISDTEEEARLFTNL